MSSYIYNFLDQWGNPTDWYGLVYAEDTTQLYLAIDEHGDPTNCRILKNHSAFSLCIECEPDPQYKEDLEFNSIETSGSMQYIFSLADWSKALKFSKYDNETHMVKLIKFKK